MVPPIINFHLILQTLIVFVLSFLIQVSRLFTILNSHQVQFYILRVQNKLQLPKNLSNKIAKIYLYFQIPYQPETKMNSTISSLPRFTIRQLVQLSKERKHKNLRQSQNIESSVNKQNNFNVTSPFYSIRGTRNVRRSEHLCNKWNQSTQNVQNQYLKKGKSSLHFSTKCSSSKFKRSFYEQKMNIYSNKIHNQSKYVKFVYKPFPQKCLPTCGLFKIKCNCCQKSLDNFNTLFQESLKKRGKWKCSGFDMTEQQKQQKIKKDITKKMIEKYINTVNKSRQQIQKKQKQLQSSKSNKDSKISNKLSQFNKINGQSSNFQSNKNNVQHQLQNKQADRFDEDAGIVCIKILKNQLNKTSQDFKKQILSYIKQLDLSLKAKNSLIDWSHKISIAFKKQVIRKYRNGRFILDETTNLMNGKKGFVDKQNGRIYYFDQYGRSQRLVSKETIQIKNKSTNRLKMLNSNDTQSYNDILSKKIKINKKVKIFDINENNINQNITSIKAWENLNSQQNRGIPDQYINDYQKQYGKYGQSQIQNIKQENKKQENNGQNNHKFNSNKILSIENLEEKKQQKKTRNQNNRNSIQFTHNFNRQKPTRNSLKKTHHNIATTKIIKLPQNQQKYDKNIINYRISEFPDEFETLCGEYKVKNEIKKQRKRRLGIIMKNLELNNEREQFKRFKKQISMNKMMKNKIQKCMKQIGCKELIMTPIQATLNHKRKAHIISQIIQTTPKQSVKNVLQFYVEMYQKNRGIKLKKAEAEEQKQDFPQYLDRKLLDTTSIQNFLKENQPYFKSNKSLLFYQLYDNDYSPDIELIPAKQEEKKVGFNIGRQFVLEEVYLSRQDRYYCCLDEKSSKGEGQKNGAKIEIDLLRKELKQKNI